MGYIKNHAIIVTDIYGDDLEKAHTEASKLFPWVSPISPEGINGSRSFFIPPDGSKEGWGDSQLGDKRRIEFKEWLRSICYDDGSSPLKWVEVWYDDEGKSGIDESNPYPKG